MENFMSLLLDIVPKWLRISVGILAIFNIAFGIMGYFDMSVLFQNGNGIDLTNEVIKNASYEFAARNLAIGLALGIVALKGVPESLAIVLIIRALVETQTIITSIVTHSIISAILMPIPFLAAELFIIVFLVKIIKKRDLALAK